MFMIKTADISYIVRQVKSDFLFDLFLHHSGIGFGFACRNIFLLINNCNGYIGQ